MRQCLLVAFMSCTSAKVEHRLRGAGVCSFCLFCTSFFSENVLKMIEQLHGKVPVDSSASHSDSTEIFKFYTDADLFYVMLFPDKWRKNEEIKNRVSLFNEKYFSNTTLATTNLLLNNATQMIIVKQFPNKQKGLNYYTAIRENAEVFKDVDKLQIIQMLIAPDNFAKLYQTKKVQEYMQFFEKILIKEPE